MSKNEKYNNEILKHNESFKQPVTFGRVIDNWKGWRSHKKCSNKMKNLKDAKRHEKYSEMRYCVSNQNLRWGF